MRNVNRLGPVIACLRAFDIVQAIGAFAVLQHVHKAWARMMMGGLGITQGLGDQIQTHLEIRPGIGRRSSPYVVIPLTFPAVISAVFMASRPKKMAAQKAVMLIAICRGVYLSAL
jgi:hypothetical protein